MTHNWTVAEFKKALDNHEPNQATLFELDACSAPYALLTEKTLATLRGVAYILIAAQEKNPLATTKESEDNQEKHYGRKDTVRTYYRMKKALEEIDDLVKC